MLYNNEISDGERRVPPSRMPECKHRRHVTQVGLLLSGPSSNWEFTSSRRDLFTSLNSEIPTSEQSGTRHNTEQPRHAIHVTHVNSINAIMAALGCHLCNRCTAYNDLLCETVHLMFPTNKWYECAIPLPIFPKADAPDMFTVYGFLTPRSRTSLYNDIK